MGIVFVRIDDRLIHGQVATTWVRNFDVEQIAVISDTLVNDPIQTSVIKMAAPVGVNAVLLTKKDFTEAYKKGFKKRTMLILTNPHDVLSIVGEGVRISSLNVGGMKFTNGKRKITESVFVTEEDIEAFNRLVGHGIKIDLQMVPSSPKKDYDQIKNFI
ncbi:PTS sugar transporter subunit IIB [Bacillus sp. F19]|nr:PTS sugar transporter subunit IIB [Bacillus sp. F19]